VPEVRVAADGGAVVRCKVGERAAEVGELGVQRVELSLGDLGGEGGEGALGLLLAIKGGEADAAQARAHPPCFPGN